MAECTIYDKLRYIAETKDLIKMAIESQDVEVLESATFRQYAEYITEIRKVSSVNGMQGDVVLTLEDLGGIALDALEGYYTKEEVNELLKDVEVDLSDYYTKEESDNKFLTEHQSLDNYYTKEEVDTAIENVDVTEQLQNYYTKDEVDNKGYITAIPEVYITEDELSTQLKDKVSETALNEALKGYYDKGEVDNLIDNVDVTEQLQNYYTKEESDNKFLTEHQPLDNYYTKEEIEAKKYLTEIPSEYITETELEDTLDIITELGYDIADLQDGKQDKLESGTNLKTINGQSLLGSGNIVIEGGGGGTTDLTGYATEDWVKSQGYLTEVPEDYVTDTDLGEAFDGYATESWVEEQGYITGYTIPDNYATKDWVGEQGYLTEHQSLEDYYTKDEVDEAIKNVDVDVDLTGYVTKAGLAKELYNNDRPYVNTVGVAATADTIYFMSTYVNGADTFSKNAEPNGDVHFKTINGEHILGTGNITIEGGGSVDLDLFEVVTELPTENISENKIYLLEDTSLKDVRVEGHMVVDPDRNDDGYVWYIQNDEVDLDVGQGTITSKYRTRVYFQGYENFTIMMYLINTSFMGAGEQLFVGIGQLNDDLSENPNPDAWYQYRTGNNNDEEDWFSITWWVDDPSQTYFFDIWTNGGKSSLANISAPVGLRVPVSEKGQNKFTEYIYNNGQWEELGKNIRMIDQEAFRSISVDANGWDGRTRVMFCNAKGNCNTFEISKINGKAIVGYDSPINIEVTATKEVTQEEYDALFPEDGVLYVITDAKEVGVPTKVSELENDAKYVTTDELNTLLGGVETKITEINNMI